MKLVALSTLVIFIPIIFAVSCGPIDKSQTEPFIYEGFNARTTDCSEESSPDDYGKEHLGRCCYLPHSLTASVPRNLTAKI